MKVQAGILGIIGVVTLASPGCAQDVRLLSVGSDSRSTTSTLIAQQPSTVPIALPNPSPQPQKWEYLVGLFREKVVKKGFLGADTTSSWIFDVDGKESSRVDGLAQLGALGWELVTIEDGLFTKESAYIFKRAVQTP